MDSIFQRSRDNLAKRMRPPNKWTLIKWRQKAKKHALAQGARWACEVCKRPIGKAATETEPAQGRFGELRLRTPVAWRCRSIRRRICFTCWSYFFHMLEEAEYNFLHDNLPPEIMGDEDAEFQQD